MAFSVNTNAGALVALQSLNSTNRLLDITQARISTGLKVSSAKDNAAIFSIAQKQRAQLGGLSSVKSSLDRASSSVNVALAAATAVSDLLIQLQTKAVAAADPGASASTRTALNDEFKSLISQINTVVNNATFNGVNAVKNGGTSIQALVAVPSATVSSSTITIAAADISASSGLALTTSTVITSAGGASAAIGVISTAQSTVTTFLSKLGAGAKRVDIQRTFTDKLSSAIQIGIGKLVDANLALESATLKSLQVKQQLGLQALSIANNAPGSVLALFR
ncbi:MAG: flagellin [Alphaproteobacteria bacterium]|nr:flagellin [Alphaproteobacteria bacterium]